MSYNLPPGVTTKMIEDAQDFYVDCRCADAACPAHIGKSECGEDATRNLIRCDDADREPIPMCEACAEDAMASGLFVDYDVEEPDDDPYD